MFFLSPANETLAEYYEKRGMIPTHCAKIREITPQSLHEAGDWQIESLQAHHWGAMQQKYSGRAGAVIWDENALGFAIEENKLDNGICLKLCKNNRTAVAVGGISGQRLTLSTLICDLQDREAVLATLAAEYHPAHMTVREAAESGTADSYVLGMSYHVKHPASAPMGPLLD